MTRLDALRSTVAELERTYRALGGDDDSERQSRGIAGFRLASTDTDVACGEGILGEIGSGVHRAGNPNHDPATGEFTSAGGGGRRKKRLHRARLKQALKKKWRAAAKAAKKDWRSYRSGYRRERKSEWNRLVNRQGGERASFRSRVASERVWLKARPAK